MENTNQPSTAMGFPPDPTGPSRADPFCPVMPIPTAPVLGQPTPLRTPFVLYDPEERVIKGAALYTEYEAYYNAKANNLCYQPGEAVPGVHYMDDQCSIVPCVPLPIIVDGHTLRDVPPGLGISINNQWVVTPTDGVLELEFPLPGTYVLNAYLAPYLPWSVTIEVQDTDTV